MIFTTPDVSRPVLPLQLVRPLNGASCELRVFISGSNNLAWYMGGYCLQAVWRFQFAKYRVL